MVDGVRFVEKTLGNPANKYDSVRFEELKQMFGKSLSVNRDMQPGEFITQADLESRKPDGKGIPSEEFRSVVGKRLKRVLRAGSFVTGDDLS